MPRRVLDFEAMWASDKLAACAEWAQAEYAWLYGLADANGSFELTNLRVIWGRVAAIRKNLSLERLEQILDEFHDKGLLFLWEENGKRYGHWTNSELPGRLPSPSWRNRLERLAPPVPREALAEYMRRFGARETFPIVANAQPELPACHPRDDSGVAAEGLKASVEPTQAQNKDGERGKDLSSLTGASQPAEPSPAPAELIRSKPGTARGITPSTLLEIYEQERGELPAVKALTAQRLSKCRARLCQNNFLLDDFRAAVRKASQTPFLCGASARGWRASFDWFVANDTNYLKVLEGRYDPPARSEPAAWPGSARAPVSAHPHAETRAGLGPSLAGAQIKPSFLEKLRQREEAQKTHARYERGSAEWRRQDSDREKPSFPEKPRL